MNTFTLKRLIAITAGVIGGVFLVTSVVTMFAVPQGNANQSNNISTSSNSSSTTSIPNTTDTSTEASSDNHQNQDENITDATTDKNSEGTRTSHGPSTHPTSSPTPKSSFFDSPSYDRNKKPNILLILADDVGTGDIPFYWNSSVVKMPNLERLAAKGVTFLDAHSTPLCAPSRYMLLSGNYAHRGVKTGGSWNFRSNGNQFRGPQKSIAEVLRDEAGYHTAMFGKWHLGSKVPPNGMYNYTHALSDPNHNWSQPLIGGPQDIGFDESLITCGGIQAPPYSFFRNGVLTTQRSDVVYWNEFSEHDMPHGTSMIGKHGGEGDANWDSTAYNMILVNETTSFIHDHIQNRPNEPFFAYVALGTVHIPHSPPNYYLDGSQICNFYQTKHLDLLLELDKVVGSLVTVIEQKQISSETIVIFTSDNGGLRSSIGSFHDSSGPLRGSKGEIYEGGHRVPMIWRYDGSVPANEFRHKMVGLNDIFATLCEIVGITVPDGSAHDSISFSKYLTSGRIIDHYREYLPTWSYKGTDGMFHAIRHNHLKLIHDTDTHQLSLFNLFDDIGETMDLSQNPENLNIMQSMFHTLVHLGPCPDDIQGIFELSQMGENGETQVDCVWFATNTVARCNLHIEGELLCNSICGRFKGECRTNLFPNQKWPSLLA